MNEWNNEILKGRLTFDNGEVYESYFDGDTSRDSYITTISTNSTESNNSGNPLGIITANGINIGFFDIDNKLMATNKQSPYYGYMRNGVKLEMFISYDGVNYTEYGTYYVTNWSTGYSGGIQDVTNIVAQDRIQYINNLDIPKLPAYSGIKVQELLVNLFIELDRATSNNYGSAVIRSTGTPLASIGKNNDYFVSESLYEIYRKIDGQWVLRYHIDNRLKLNMIYGITVGTKYREALNSITQAIVARVILDRYDVIRVVPALESYGSVYELLDNMITSINTKHNSNNIYSKARVKYNQLGENRVDTILYNYGVKVVSGKNEFTGLKFNGKTLSIEDVYFDTDLDVDISNIEYSGYQDGIDISFNSNKSSVVDICVEGRLINSVEASEESDIQESDVKVGNTLTISSDIIQDKEEAKKLSDSIAVYLSKTNKLITLGTMLTPKVTVGDIIQYKSVKEEFDGTYKVLNDNTQFGMNYTKTITLMKISDKIVFNDDGLWMDDDDNGIWIE